MRGVLGGVDNRTKFISKQNFGQWQNFQGKISIPRESFYMALIGPWDFFFRGDLL